MAFVQPLVFTSPGIMAATSRPAAATAATLAGPLWAVSLAPPSALASVARAWTAEVGGSHGLVSPCPAAVAAAVAVASARRLGRDLRRRRHGCRVGVAPSAVARKAAPNVKDQFVDEVALLEKSTFPIKPEKLIEVCKEVLGRGAGTTTEGMPDLADDFEFCAPFVGPIGKEAYLKALATFNIVDGFPDQNPNYHFFRVDPFQPNRVWFQTRQTGTNTGQFAGQPPTGNALTFPPQSFSMIFNDAGKVQEFTVGYVVDRRIGNTGGLGGAFGFFYGVGKPLPFPEARPYKRSWKFRLLSFLGSLKK